MRQAKQGKREKNRQRGTVVRALSFFTQVGVTIFACVFLGVILGRFLDRVLGTAPWLLLACSLLGTAAAFMELFRLAKNK